MKCLNSIQLLLITLTILISCSKPKSADNKPINDEVVIVFDKNFIDEKFPVPGVNIVSDNSNGAIIYTETNNKVLYYYPTSNDTLTIPCMRDYIEVCYDYLDVEKKYYLLSKGDTIVMSVDSINNLVVKSSFLKLQGIYPLFNNIELKEEKLWVEPLTLFYNLSSFMLKLEELMGNSSQSLLNLKGKFRDWYVPLNTIKDNYSLYIDNYKNNLLKLKNDENIPLEYYNYYNYIMKLKEWQYFIADCIWKNEYIDANIENILSDSLLCYSSYRLFISDYLNLYYYKNKKMPLISIDSGSRYDYITLFDTLVADNEIPPKTQILMLQDCIEGIIEYNSIADIELYTSKYLDYTKDSLFIDEVHVKHNIDHTKKNYLLLNGYDDTKTNLNKVLKSHRGKVVLVSFWASWCPPCIESIPYASELRQKFRENDLSIIYLAYNDKEEHWRSSIDKYKLNTFAENYIIENNKSSHILEQLQLTTIPRYLIFNRNGKLVESNAPSPRDELLYKTINGYIDDKKYEDKINKR